MGVDRLRRFVCTHRTRLKTKSLRAVSEAPTSGKVSAEVLWAGASDTALRLLARLGSSLEFNFRFARHPAGIRELDR